jgi:hypothetical protein
VGCHIFSIQHKNKTAKSRFGSEKNTHYQDHAGFAKCQLSRQLQENANLPRRPAPLYNKAEFWGTQEESDEKYKF